MRLAVVLALIGCLILAACKGGGSQDPQDPGGPGNPGDPGNPGNPGGGTGTGLVAVINTQIPLLESYSLLSSNPIGGSAVWVGDSGASNSMNAEYRGMWRFDISGMKKGAEILSASLQVTRRPAFDSGDPLSLMGYIQLDDVYGEGNLVGHDAMYNHTLAPNFTRLDPWVGYVYSADVTDRLQAAVDAERTRFNLRAHWLNLSPNDQMDAFLFDFPGDGKPLGTLVVTYK